MFINCGGEREIEKIQLVEVSVCCSKCFCLSPSQSLCLSMWANADKNALVRFCDE